MSSSLKPPAFIAKQVLVGICVLALVAVMTATIDQLGIGGELVRSIRLMIS